MAFRSLIKFDNILKEEAHLNIHQEMLPYIGPEYEKHRILLISESHFVPKDQETPTDEQWYNPVDLKKLLEEVEFNTFTREIIEKIFTEKKTHRLFNNFQSALKKTNIAIGLENISWYNFFQKPASNKLSINPTTLDYEIAKRVFEKVIETLKPNLIVFTSVKSFNFLLADLNWSDANQSYMYKTYNFKIDFVPHPNSQWWYRKCKKYMNKTSKEERTGQQKFIDLVNLSV